MLLASLAITAWLVFGDAHAGQTESVPIVECDASAIDEGEADCGYPVDAVDGGCSTSPPLFLPISCGDVICGTSRQWSGYDFDAFVFVPEAPVVVTWSGTADFHCFFWISDGTLGCAESEILASILAEPGEQAEVSAALSAGGTYWFYVRASAYDYFQCGGVYQVALTCEPIVYGACCLPSGACSNLPAVTCASQDGTYLGDGTTCAGTVCPNGPGACCTADGACTDAHTQIGCEGLDGVYYGGGSLCAQIACIYPEEPFTREGEPICYDGYVDDFNGGCDPPVSYWYRGYMFCPMRFVGYSGTYLAPDGSRRRDMDLFQLVDLPHEPTRYLWRVTAAFPVQIGFAFVNDFWGIDLCNWQLEATASAAAYETATIDIDFAFATDSCWFLYVRPQAGVQGLRPGTPYIADLTSEPAPSADCAFQIHGDANCDGDVNVFDIDAFVIALAQGEAAWTAAYGGEVPWPPFVDCGYPCVNDCNHDGAVNVFDIDPFVRILVGY
jgi:hypothetical protein